jgi:hypothetical protein
MKAASSKAAPEATTLSIRAAAGESGEGCTGGVASVDRESTLADIGIMS